MKKHIVRGILAFGLVAGPMLGVASAQQSTGYQGSQGMDTPHVNLNADTNKKDTDWGWLGLIGLGGLAGLLRKPQQEDQIRQRTTGYRTGEPIGSR